LQQLDAIAKNSRLSNQQKTQRLSQLLRQVAMSTHPREQVAGLAGEQWLAFLDGDDPQKSFSEGLGRSLIDAPYRPDADLETDALIALVRGWIKQAKKHKSSPSRGL